MQGAYIDRCGYIIALPCEAWHARSRHEPSATPLQMLAISKASKPGQEAGWEQREAGNASGPLDSRRRHALNWPRHRNARAGSNVAHIFRAHRLVASQLAVGSHRVFDCRFEAREALPGKGNNVGRFKPSLTRWRTRTQTVTCRRTPASGHLVTHPHRFGEILDVIPIPTEREHGPLREGTHDRVAHNNDEAKTPWLRC
eukprot:scaffold99889_cov29-Tisochrysis_lutea.AAC.3